MRPWVLAAAMLVVGLICGGIVGSQVFPRTVTTTETFSTTRVEMVTETRVALSEEEYKVWAVKFALDIIDFSQALTVTADAIASRDLSFSDGAEIFEALEALTRRMHEEAKSIIPPSKYEKAHNHLINAIDYYHQSFAYSAEGARKLDANLLKKAVELSTLANAELILARESIPEISETKP